MLELFTKNTGIREDKAILMIIEDKEQLQKSLISIFKDNRIAYEQIVTTLEEKNLAVNFKDVSIEKIKRMLETVGIENNVEM